MEPRWRTVLCWSAVIAFFTVPIVGLYLILAVPSVRENLEHYKFIGTFFQSVSALVFGLSGLRSLDKYVETRNGRPKDHHPPNGK